MSKQFIIFIGKLKRKGDLFLNEKFNEAEKRLIELNKRLNELQKAGVKTDFANAAVNSIEKILRIAAELESRGEQNHFESGSFELAPKTKVDYKLGVHVGLDSFPEEKEAVPVEASPLLQVFEEGKQLRIVAEFPGTKEDELQVELLEKELVVRIPGKDFVKRIQLPDNMKLLNKSFKNCVLELVLEKLF